VNTGDREDVLVRAASPVERSRDEQPERAPQPGIGLCLSGGGYRAMLFHVGALRRLNELGYLPRLKRVSSVSGGSITAGVLALKWNRLGFDASGTAQRFGEEVQEPLRRLAAKTIDKTATFLGVVGPGSVANRIADSYRRALFGDAKLSDLPAEPRFVFNATNLQSGALFRFSKPYLRDYRVGEVPNPTVDLATAVAASSAFPPFLSPLTLRLRDDQWAPAGEDEDLHRSPFTTSLVLSDGGVYDNLGLETVWKRYDTVFVSDGGGQMQPEEKPSAVWPLQSVRVLSVIDNQVRSLRKRQVIDSYKAGIRKGVYWGIRTNVADYRVEMKLDCPFERTLELAALKTRLAELDRATQERLVNWGYAVCDAGLRAHVDSSITVADRFPYPGSGVG
jgi:NTE family protein